MWQGLQNTLGSMLLKDKSYRKKTNIGARRNLTEFHRDSLFCQACKTEKHSKYLKIYFN